MNHTLLQSPSAVVMVRPHRFTPNPQTAHDNTFQSTAANNKTSPTSSLADKAYEEVSHVAERLREAGVEVHLFEDLGKLDTPDSVFPNNWFSTHSGGHIALYPMFAHNRRRERRYDIIDMLKADYRVQDVIDYSGLEADGLFLEGTGAMVLDHVERVAYACLSQRTSEVLLERFCTHFNYEPMAYPTLGEAGKPVYHTNVMMCLGETFAVICADCIDDKKERKMVLDSLRGDEKEVILITEDQVNNFAGNMLEVKGADDRRYLVMSKSAHQSLTKKQIAQIEEHVTILSSSLDTIEACGGGSARCMMAEIFLPRE